VGASCSLFLKSTTVNLHIWDNLMTTPKLRVINGGKNYTDSRHYLPTGVNVSDYRYIPAGAIITNQKDASYLPFLIRP
jgi:hypothetical protein